VLLTLFEYGEVDYDWSAQDLAALGRLNESVRAEVLHAGVSGRAGRKVLQARQYAGVVRLGHATVQILPKIYRSDTPPAERAHEATRNLLYMLSFVGLIPLREHELAPLLQRNLDWFEVLTYLFATHLAEEWQHGAPHAYQEREAELNVLRGKWLLSEHLRHPSQRERLPVRYAEFGVDHALNRVLRYVVEHLWRLTRDPANRRRLADLRVWMDEVTLLPLVSAADAHPALITRLNARYEPLLNLARVFLSQSTLQLAAGQTTAFGLLLDMARLFQEFIVRFIARRRSEVLPAGLQGCELLPQAFGAAQYLARLRPSGEAVFGLYPDLAFCAGARFPLLLDTKYKRLPARRVRVTPAQDDLYQAFSYAHSFRCPRVILLYPQGEGQPGVRQSFDVQGLPSRIEVATVNLQVDLRAGQQQLTSELRSILGNDAQR
jgi:5-methylcytosine-specific restriction enzyme subunit McrC